jgi:hypothetical protein
VSAVGLGGGNSGGKGVRNCACIVGGEAMASPAAPAANRREPVPAVGIVLYPIVTPHSCSTAPPLYFRFPIIFSSGFSKVKSDITLGGHGGNCEGGGVWQPSRDVCGTPAPSAAAGPAVAGVGRGARRSAAAPVLGWCTAVSEKGVRLAQNMQIGLYIPVGIQLEKTKVGPTSGPTWRLSHLCRRVAGSAGGIQLHWIGRKHRQSLTKFKFTIRLLVKNEPGSALSYAYGTRGILHPAGSCWVGRAGRRGDAPPRAARVAGRGRGPARRTRGWQARTVSGWPKISTLSHACIPVGTRL